MALENIGEVWRRASLIQRMTLLTIVLGCFGGAALLVNWARKPSLALLYSGLPPEEAAGVVEKVRDAGIAYELKQGGTAVYVAEDKVYSLRLTMASAGLAIGDNRGYRILDEQDFGKPPFIERVNVKRAIEGELAKSIQTLDAVVSARVHVASPESPLFRKGDNAATASVIVKLKGGYQLSSANVAAIRYLVSGGVEGLSPDKVCIVDTHGTPLSGDSDEGGINSTMTTVLDQKRQVEEYLARKAERQLLLVLGPNRATVQVSVEMDTTTTESQTTQYGPEKGLPSKEMVKTSRSTEPSREKGVEAGVTSDETIETEYKLTEKTQRTTTLAGGVTKKSVAVVVDLTAPKKEGEEATASAAKLMEVQDVWRIVKMALGLDVPDNAPAGGGAGGATTGTDSLTVEEAVFYRDPQVAGLVGQDEGMFNKDFLLEIARRSSLGLLVIGALLALKMFSGKKKAAALEGSPLAALTGQPGGAAGGLLPASAGEGDSRVLKAQITRALQSNPEEVKRLFLRWVESETGET
ncbi:MAG: flagellar basal-body MS-ring/collar protein FliF [Phycisphaerae bacterium]